MTATQLRYAVADGVATITLHRPERLNAFTPVMAAELAAAAAAADAAPDELPLAASAAKALAAEVLERAAETAVQVHGGIGFTWEHDAHLYWRRAKVDRLILGDAAEHLDDVARLAVAGALG